MAGSALAANDDEATKGPRPDEIPPFTTWGRTTKSCCAVLLVSVGSTGLRNTPDVVLKSATGACRTTGGMGLHTRSVVAVASVSKSWPVQLVKLRHTASVVAVAVVARYSAAVHVSTAWHTRFADTLQSDTWNSDPLQVRHDPHSVSSLAVHGVCSYVDPATHDAHDEQAASK